MNTSIILPDNELQFIAKTPKEIRLEHEIAILEADLRYANRILERRDDYLAMIDWSAMSIDDREIVHDYGECLNWSIFEIDHQIRDASDRYYEAYMENPLNW